MVLKNLERRERSYVCPEREVVSNSCSYRLLWQPVVVWWSPVVHGRVGRGVHGLVFLLLRHLLQRQEPVLTHLDTFRHVAHACVF